MARNNVEDEEEEEKYGDSEQEDDDDDNDNDDDNPDGNDDDELQEDGVDEDDDEEDNEDRIAMRFRDLVQQLALTCPDTLTAKKRTVMMNAVKDMLTDHTIVTTRVLAEWRDLKCSSSHAYRRVVPLYTKSLLLLQRRGGGIGGVDDVVVGMQKDDSNSSKSIVRGLLQELTNLLGLSADAELVESCRNDLCQARVGNNILSMSSSNSSAGGGGAGGTGGSADEGEDEEEEAAAAAAAKRAKRNEEETAMENVKKEWTEMLYDIARSTAAAESEDTTAAAGSLSTVEATISAVALGSALEMSLSNNSSAEQQQQRPDWLSILLDHSLTHFSSPTDMMLAKTFLQTTMPSDAWSRKVSPALKLRVKSHPDKALVTVKAWVELLAWATTTTTTATEAQQSPLPPTNGLTIDEEWLSILQKHVQGAKEENRSLAGDVMVAWAVGSYSGGGGTNNLNTVSCIVNTLATTKAPLAPARVTVYESLERIAKQLVAVVYQEQQQQQQRQEPEASNFWTGIPTTSVLQGLLEMVSKETATKTDPTRMSGLAAIVEWMVLAKKIASLAGTAVSDKSVDTPLLLQGYKQAMDTVVEKKIAEAGQILGLLVQRVHPDLLESMVVDLWKESKDPKKWVQGLEALVENANGAASATGAAKGAAGKKVSAQVEGLLAVYFTLLYADQSSSSFGSDASSAASGKVPACVAKILQAGSSSMSIAATGTTGKGVVAKGSKSTTAVATPALAAPAAAASSSFLFSKAMMDAVSSNPVVSAVLPRTIALYTRLASKQSLPDLFPNKAKVSGAARMIAACATHPTSVVANANLSIQKETYASNAIVASLEMILTYQPKAAEPIVQALLEQVNATSTGFETLVKEQNATREAREADPVAPVSNSSPGTASILSNSIFSVKGQGSDNASHRGFDANAVRRVARLLARHCRDPVTLARVMVLMHAGSSLRSEGHQRAALILNTLHTIKDVILSLPDEKEIRKALADEILALGTCASITASSNEDPREDGTISISLHEAALSLITSLGGIACNFSDGNDAQDEMKPYALAISICNDEIATRLSEKLKSTLKQIEALSEKDVSIYLSPMGVLFEGESKSSNDQKKSNKRLTEDEEWELQLKKELAEKKKQEQAGQSKSLSAEEQKMLAQQDELRTRVSSLLNDDYLRILGAIRALCSSDIEVGNKCLPKVSESVLMAAVSSCPAVDMVRSLQAEAFRTLTTLSACVYEIHEMHAPTLAQALAVCCRKEKKTDSFPIGSSDSKEATENSLQVIALPSPCASAACVIYEMDQYHDTLSSASFAFLFPVIRASLMGPRTPTGCEAALRVLERHTVMLAGEEYDPVVAVLRKDMVISILELLKHDRAQTFQEPTPYEALIACYRVESDLSEGHGPALTTAALAPLLDERGSLGSKSCRIGAMKALAVIAESHRKLLKNNPLVENRIWLNCFEADEDIRSEARRAWAIVNDTEVAADQPLPNPSPLYAVPLLPLLSHSEKSIAMAAADAYAYAMGVHAGSVGRNIEILCKTYIDAFPTPGDGGSKDGSKAGPSKASVPALAAPAPAKKTISIGLPKKAAAPKPSALAVAGIGKPKVAIKKKSAVASALLKPKEERTHDRELLESQFKAVGTKKEEKDSQSKIQARLGVLRAIAATTNASFKVEMDATTLTLLTSFLMAYGIADNEEDVKGSARNTLRDVVATHGGSDQAIAFLLPHLETVLKTGVADESALGSLPTDKVPRDVGASDRRKEGAVVALGSVALHLKGQDNETKIDSTIDMLISALKTPSEDVQSSVADALTKLMKKGRTQDRMEKILTDIMRDCLSGSTLAVRRGAAYGLAAAVKGSGIVILKKYDIVKQLDDACANGNANSKEGSLFAIELLSDRLGLLFEPYVIVLLPSLLKSFSDSSDHVRKAASNTAGLIMSKLSAHGVKLVMPAVLTAFNDSSWRTKQASIHMLGAMSHLAPKQLASALPKVVPKLTEAFSDTHQKVKASAQEALDEISTVIRNPEISSISSALLKALTDPADYTVKALETLIQTEFLHAIDAPSLALIVPILHRGLRERGASTKRYGGLIAGNICTMINDPRDFVPYLPTLLPDLQAALLDPIPDVRTTSARALGSLTRSLGDQILPELRPWLIQKLREQACSSAERSGAAQGLTEVLIASGSAMVDDAMRNEILPLHSFPDASTREGVLWMLTFLPPAMGQGFTPLIDVSLPALINGLSDDSEPVRDVAMRAGRVLIRSHGKVHYDKILPSLEIGLSDDDYRIRVSSLSLLGDLLSTIGGTSVVKGDGNTQDDIRKAERAQAQIALVLGSETRKRVLSGLYLARSDPMHAVRQLSIQVWKTVVSVTARTLRDILPVLVSKIIDSLASGHEEKTVVAGRCLGDVVSKLGDSVLPQIIPVLRNALAQGDEHTKRGVCVGLTEVIKCSTKEQIIKFIEVVVKLVQDALSDDDDKVREMAAASFKSLHSVVGNVAFDQVVPSLLVALEMGDKDEASRKRALNGLTGILSVRSRELLPYIVPRLIQRPITVNHAKALGGIANVTSTTLQLHFTTIIPAILGDLAESVEGSEEEAALRECSRSLCKFVDGSGVNVLVSEIVSKSGSDKAPLRRESCRMFEVLITERADKQDFYEQIPIIIRELLYRLNDDNASVLKATNGALFALSNHVAAEELVKHIEFMRNLMASMVSDARRRKGGVGDGDFFMPGFNMAKGLEPLLPIYQRGILYGTPTIREVSAAGLGEVLNITSTKYLAGPLIIKMTGPLLRIVGDRNPSNVKVAILKTLGLILVKGGPALRAFVPQFQTTFVKALSDPSRQVRLEAIAALSLLMPLTTRVDPLIKELVSGSLGKNVTDEGQAVAAAVQTATLQALAAVLEKGGDKAKLPASLSSALDASLQLLDAADEGIREAAASVMGSACFLLGADSTLGTLKSKIIAGSQDDSGAARHGKACAIRFILEKTVGSEIQSAIPDLKKISLVYLSDDKSNVREAGCIALGAVIGRSLDPKAAMRESESVLKKVMENSKETLEIHRAVAKGLCVALMMIQKEKRVDFMGLSMMDACLQMALSGAQRVQFAYNDVLWLALDVASGDAGLDRYADLAMFDNVRSMKSLHSKVLTKIKAVTLI